MNNVNTMDKYFKKRKELLASQTTTRIYCDASFKDDIMVSGILIIGPGHDKTCCKRIINHGSNVLAAEIDAIKMAIGYIKEKHIKEAIVYTEIDSVLHAYPFIVVLGNSNSYQTPKEHREILNKYRSFWNFFRSVHNSPSHRITIDKVKSANNPAHSIVCMERDRILQKSEHKNYARWLAMKIGTLLVKWSKL